METKQFYEDIDELYRQAERDDTVPDIVRDILETNRFLKRKIMKLETIIIFQKTVIADLKAR